MATIPVSIELNRLFCFHGADEDVSEPYLWSVVVTLDGRTITHAPGALKLTGGPGYFFSPGSHGNLGGGVHIGETRMIPRAVGRVDATLQPILLSAAGRTVEVPGHIAVIAVLLEEDSTSDEGAEAAHQAINNLIRAELDEAVADINLAGLAAEIQQAVAAGTSPEDAATALFTEKIDRVVDRIQRYAKSTAVTAIVEKLSFPSAIVEAADPDGFMGIATHFFSQDELAATSTTERIEFTDVIAEPGVTHLESSDYVYNLHGWAWQPVEVFWVPVTEEVPAGRWQVTGINRSGRPGKQYISHVGGVFADGSPWLLPKGKVMDLLVARTHTFFVRSTTTGREADVAIDSNEDNPFFPFLTTAGDDDPSNNLGSLPQCPLAIRHTRPAPG